MNSAGLRFYRLATGALEPVAPWLLRARAMRGKEDPERLAERLGWASASRPAGRLVWLHGASVGESLSLLTLAEALARLRPDAAILFTSGTRAAATVLAARLPPDASHQYVPVDGPRAARRFLAYWRPDLAVLAESELWPNLLLGAKRRGTRLVLAGARLSRASLARWRRAPSAALALLGAFDLILARDPEAARGLEAVGARVNGVADLKLGGIALPVDAAEAGRLRTALAGRALLLAASTHPGEEEMILRAYAKPGSCSGRLLVIAPRHVERGAAIAAMVTEAGLTVGRRSLGDDPTTRSVHVADTLGEMGLWYSLARLALIGGSLLPGAGGHNPLEAARLGCPAVSGGHVENWPIVLEMAAAGALAMVDGDAGLTAAFQGALDAPDPLVCRAAKARAFVDRRDGETRAALGRIVDLLPP